MQTSGTWQLLDRLDDAAREALLQEADPEVAPAGPGLLCARCKSRVTSQGARIERADAHLHECTNPHGVEYLLGCFSVAAVTAVGEPTRDFSWFPGYAWQIAHCDACGLHLGWRFSAETDVFFGLVLDQLLEEDAG